MRHFKHRDGSSGVRSNYNGPVQRKFFRTSELYSGKPVDIPYAAVKPYTSATLNVLTEPNLGLATVLDVKVPTVAELLEAVLGSEPTFETSLFSELVDDRYAVNGALENAQAYGELLMLVTAAEAGDTIKMIRNVFVRLWNVFLDMYSAVKRLNLHATLDVLTSLWLEFRYGWRPLVGEIGSIANELDRIKVKGIHSSYGTYKGDLPTTVLTRTATFPSSRGSTTWDVEFRPQGQYTIKTGFNYVNKQGSRNENFASIWGLDWQSLASTAWELVPFSFVVDFFLNIGSLLQARDVHDQVSSFNGFMTCIGNFSCKATPRSQTETKQVSLWDFLSKDLQTAIKADTRIRHLFIAADSRTQKLFRDSNDLPVYTRRWINDRSIGFYESSEFGRSFSYGEAYEDINANYMQLYQMPRAEYLRSEKYWKDRKIITNSQNFYIWKEFYQNYPGFGWSEGEFLMAMNLRYNVPPEITINGFDTKGFLVGSTYYSLLGLANLFNEALSLIYRDCTMFKTEITDYSGRVLTDSDIYAIAKAKEWSGIKVYDVRWLSNEIEAEGFTDEQADDMSYNFNMKLLQRTRRSEFEHTFTSDIDLSSGQFADLGALSWTLISRLFENYRPAR